MQPPSDLQQKARLIEVNRQRLKQLKNQISQLELIQSEHLEVSVSLKALSVADPKSKPSLIPLGAGVHIPLSYEENGHIIIDLGGGILAEKPYEEGVEMLQKRAADIGIIIDQLFNEAKTIEQKVAEMATLFNSEAANLSPTIGAEIEQNEEANSESIPVEKSKPSRRRKGFGGELTLDD